MPPPDPPHPASAMRSGPKAWRSTPAFGRRKRGPANAASRRSSSPGTEVHVLTGGLVRGSGEMSDKPVRLTLLLLSTIDASRHLDQRARVTAVHTRFPESRRSWRGAPTLKTGGARSYASLGSGCGTSQRQRVPQVRHAGPRSTNTTESAMQGYQPTSSPWALAEGRSTRRRLATHQVDRLAPCKAFGLRDFRPSSTCHARRIVREHQHVLGGRWCGAVDFS